MVIEVPRPIEKIGGSWIVRLDSGTRKLLGVSGEGQVIMLRKRGFEDGPTEKRDVEELE